MIVKPKLSKQVMYQNCVKTPLQIVQNPLKTHNFGKVNNSNSDEFSLSSEDDLYFLEEDFWISPFGIHNNIHIQNNNEEVTRIYFNNSDCQSDVE